MNKTKLLKILNPLIMLNLVIQVISGVLLEDHHWIKELHEVSGVILCIFTVIHLYLNFAWIKNQYLKKS